MKDSEHSKHHEHSEEFYTQEEMEEIFTRGINIIIKKSTAGSTQLVKPIESVNPTELWDLTNKCLNELNGKLPQSEIRLVEELKDEFHHWFKVHSGTNNGHILEGDFKITLNHMEKIQPPNGNVASYDCNLLVDEWFKWFFTTPVPDNPFARPEEQNQGSLYGASNEPYLFQKRGAEAYFATASPFKSPGPDVRKITLTKRYGFWFRHIMFLGQ